MVDAVGKVNGETYGVETCSEGAPAIGVLGWLGRCLCHVGVPNDIFALGFKPELPRVKVTK